MSTFTLKMTALLLMVLDHIGYYFEGAPAWLGWLGRGSYPLFLFCMVWGYHHTRSRKKYLLRLYLMSVFMTALGFAVDSWFPTEYGYGNHNIFLPLFLVGVLISAIELYQKDRKRGSLLLGAIFAMQVVYYLLPSFLPAARMLSGDTLTGLIPNLAVNEYGFEFVALGVLMYFLREKKDLLCVTYLLFCISQFSAEMLASGGATQWMMVIVLPLILRYNGEKGPGLKSFFYVFYPAHTLLLFWLANFVLTQRAGF